MIQKCEKCSSMYNDKTVSHCPACTPAKKRSPSEHRNRAKIAARRDGKLEMKFQIKDYKYEVIGDMKKRVTSERNSDVSKYEARTGKKVFDSF